ncbi:uncharacterized protein LOC124190685 [Daphnia pulex]|uniref:uncharacterized protein LOC124190685 n=1 Tax=Daphnia pulex TaxID=6669 RepID=UPI001EDF8AE1|nr:uncharacterized protein LOC124190685 [Daphnia pulex]
MSALYTHVTNTISWKIESHSVVVFLENRILVLEPGVAAACYWLILDIVKYSSGVFSSTPVTSGSWPLLLLSDDVYAEIDPDTTHRSCLCSGFPNSGWAFQYCRSGHVWKTTGRP